jgi:hypothetical protein
MDYYAGIDVSLEQSSVCEVDSTGPPTPELPRFQPGRSTVEGIQRQIRSTRKILV